MSDLWPFIVTGIATGSLYGIAAMGLVLTYKTSGIFNFGHGAIAAGAAYLFYEMHIQHGMPWPLAGLICVGVAAPLAGIVMERIMRGLAGAPSATTIVATVGVLLVVQGTATAIYGAASIAFPPFLSQRLYKIGGTNVTADQLIAVAIAALAAGGLYAFFRFSRTGIAMRGVVDNPDLLGLAGTSPVKVRTRAWMIGNAFAALSGILLAPRLGLDAVLLTLLVVQAFGAAAVAAFTSLPLAYLGGLVLGVGGAISTRYVVDVPSLAGFPPSLPFIVLFVVLLATPKGRFVEAGRRRRATQRKPMDERLAWGGRLALLVGLVIVPHVVGTRLPVYINGLIFVIIFLSLQLLVRTSGQVSLCHAAFAAVGAAGFAHLSHGAGLPWPVALVGAGVVTVPIGAVVAIPAIRLSGVYLALATFGFGILMERMVFPMAVMFGGSGSREAPRPRLSGIDLSSDIRYYYVCLFVVLLVFVGMFVLNRSRLGRLLLAMADSPVALATHGTAVNVTRVMVFCISAFLAGIAGALFAAFSGSIGGIGFGAFASITWLAVLALAGSGEFSAAVIASLLIAIVPTYADSPTYTELQPVIFGALALVAALVHAGNLDVRGLLARLGTRSEDRSRYSPVRERHASAGTGSEPALVGAGGQP